MAKASTSYGALPWAALAIGGLVMAVAAPRFLPKARRGARKVVSVRYSTPATSGARPSADPAAGKPA